MGRTDPPSASWLQNYQTCWQFVYAEQTIQWKKQTMLPLLCNCESISTILLRHIFVLLLFSQQYIFWFGKFIYNRFSSPIWPRLAESERRCWCSKVMISQKLFQIECKFINNLLGIIIVDGMKEKRKKPRRY